MGIKRLDQTMLSELIEGDRFYIGNNKNKIYQFVGVVKRSGKIEYHYSSGRILKVSKSDKRIIYLRNIND